MQKYVRAMAHPVGNMIPALIYRIMTGIITTTDFKQYIPNKTSAARKGDSGENSNISVTSSPVSRGKKKLLLSQATLLEQI